MTTPYTINREEWEQPGWEISAHTNSPPVDWSKVTNITLHYPGSSNLTPSDMATRQRLIDSTRASQKSYVNSRGYSYGYNAVVWGSESAEVRGAEYRCAANGGTGTNTPSYAIQIKAGGIEDRARPASTEEVEQVRKIVAWAEACAGRRLDILGHRDHKATGCPGDPIYAQVKLGVFRPREEEEDDMTPITPVRLYDSRQHSILEPGKPREIKAVSDRAFVSLAAGDAASYGYLSIAPTSKVTDTSIVNYQGGPQYIANSTVIGTTDKSFWVTANVSACHIVVDQYAS